MRFRSLALLPFLAIPLLAQNDRPRSQAPGQHLPSTTRILPSFVTAFRST